MAGEIQLARVIGDLRRRTGSTEQAVAAICNRLESSDEINRGRIAEVHQRVNETREEMTQFRTESRLANKQHVEAFTKLDEQLRPIIETHQAMAGLPKIIKWAAIILGGISTIIGALIALFIYLQTLAQAAVGT